MILITKMSQKFCNILVTYLLYSSSYNKNSQGFKVEAIVLHHLKLQGAYNKFPDFFRMGTFIDSTHMKI